MEVGYKGLSIDQLDQKHIFGIDDGFHIKAIYV
jgi:hypothetical protein